MPPPRSPRAKTLAHLQALVAAAAATATAVGCGKSKAEKKNVEDPYGSSGYAVVDPMPEPAIHPPPVPASLVYTGQVKVTVKQEKGGKSVFRFAPADAAPDLVLDDVVTPTTVVKKETVAKTRELVVTVEKTSQIVVSAHGEAGTFKITAAVGDAGALTVTLSQ